MYHHQNETFQDLENTMWQQLDKIEDEMHYNEIIDEPFYDEIFGIPFDYEYVERDEFSSDLKSYEAVPGDQLKESKTSQKKKNQESSGNHRQTQMVPHEQIFKQEQANMQKKEEEVNLEEQANLHRLTNLKKQTDQQFNQPQATDVETIMMSPPTPFISWGRQHLPNRELTNNPSPFSLQPSPQPPTIQNIFESSPTKAHSPPSEREEIKGFPKKESESSDYLRRKRNEAAGFNPPQISYYFTLDDAINRNLLHHWYHH